MIEIIRQGIYTSIQDKGRLNLQDYGVPFSGALDQQAFGFANKLLNNSENAAALECSFKGPKILFHMKTYITLTGADMDAKINENYITNYIPIQVNKGDILDMKTSKNGCRTYIGIEGGFKSEKILGSRSQFIGITKNKKIEKRTLIYHEKSNNYFSQKSHLIKPKIDYKEMNIEVYPGPEFNLLKQKQKDFLINNTFHISKLNNRMAYRLNEKLKNQLPQIWTSPILPGQVQCTPDGNLIILMRDAHVTGGYPRIFQLSDNAINLLSQKTTRDQIQFKLIDPIY